MNALSDDALDVLEVRITTTGTRLVPLRELADAVKTRRQTLNRIVTERQIERLKFPADRRTWVPLEAMLAALDEPQRRPGRVPRPGGQLRDDAGKFAPLPDTTL